MTPPIQGLDPNQVENSPSFKIYSDACRTQAQQQGKGSKAFDPAQAVVINRAAGDGRFEILHQSPGDDLFCAAQINWQNQEMLIDGGRLSDKKKAPLGAIWMVDACSFTKGLLGVQEFGGKACQDGVVDPRVSGVSQLDSIQYYLKTCNGLLKAHGEKFGRLLEGQVTANRVALINPVETDGVFHLLFNSGAYRFTCEGTVDTFAHQMTVSAGPINNEEKREVQAVEELTDDCTLTRRTLGEAELAVECKDKTKQERAVESGIETSWKVVMTGLAVRDVYQFVRKRPTLLGRTLQVIRHPIASASRFAGWARGLASGIRIFSPVAATGTAAAETGAITTAGATTAGGATAAGGTGAAAAGTGVTFGAATLGWCALALGVGIGVGILIEKTPRWLGAKKSVSDGIAWLIDGGVGIGAWATAKVVGKSTEAVKAHMTRTNIEILDHLGFGSWNTFKSSWGFN